MSPEVYVVHDHSIRRVRSEAYYGSMEDPCKEDALKAVAKGQLNSHRKMVSWSIRYKSNAVWYRTKQTPVHPKFQDLHGLARWLSENPWGNAHFVHCSWLVTEHFEKSMPDLIQTGRPKNRSFCPKSVQTLWLVNYMITGGYEGQEIKRPIEDTKEITYTNHEGASPMFGEELQWFNPMPQNWITTIQRKT